MFERDRFCGHRLKSGSLDASRATKSPKDARQPKHQLALYSRFNVIVGNHGGFEGLVILCILECRNDGLGRKTVAQCIAARTLFTFWRRWPGTIERVAAIGFDLLERTH